MFPSANAAVLIPRARVHNYTTSPSLSQQSFPLHLFYRFWGPVPQYTVVKEQNRSEYFVDFQLLLINIFVKSYWSTSMLYARDFFQAVVEAGFLLLFWASWPRNQAIQEHEEHVRL